MNPYLTEAAIKWLEPYLRSRGRALDFDKLNALLYTQDFEAFLGTDDDRIHKAFATYDHACGYGPAAQPSPDSVLPPLPVLPEPVRQPGGVDPRRSGGSASTLLGGSPVEGGPVQSLDKAKK